MPRVNSVKSARKEHHCRKCGKTIEIGQPYIYWEFRYGGTVERCMTCPRPRHSELTQSDKLSALWAASESVEDAITAYESESWDDIANFDVSSLSEALRSAAEEVRSIGEQYQESADNIPIDGSTVKEECEEKSGACEEWADTLEQAADEIDSIAPESPDDPELIEISGSEEEQAAAKADNEELQTAYDEAVIEAIEEAQQEAIEKANEAISNTPDFM